MSQRTCCCKFWKLGLHIVMTKTAKFNCNSACLGILLRTKAETTTLMDLDSFPRVHKEAVESDWDRTPGERAQNEHLGVDPKLPQLCIKQGGK